MRADDDGFVGSPKKIVKMIGCSNDDLKLLIAKQYIFPFDSGVCVIKDWKIHNYIQSDRYHPTVYTKEKEALGMAENKSYTNCIQTVSKVDTEVRLGKDRLEIDKDSTAKPLTDIQKLVEKMFELAGVTDSLTKKANFARQTRYAKQLIDEDGFEMAVKLTEMA